MALNAVVIDSSEHRAHQVARRLRENGCGASAVASAPEALALLSAGDGAVLFASCHIASLPIHELAESAKRARPDCTVVALFDQALPGRPKGMCDPYIDEHLPYACRDHVLREVLAAMPGAGRAVPARAPVGALAVPLSMPEAIGAAR